MHIFKQGLGVEQPAIAKIERQTDLYLSTLRRFVEAAGGTLELRVALPGTGAFTLTGLGESDYQTSGHRSFSAILLQKGERRCATNDVILVRTAMTMTFPERGVALLNDAWNIALEASGAHIHRADLASASDKVFAGSEAGYQKAIIIQAAGKAAAPHLDAQAMQKGMSGEKSWDAREFAKQVFVPWNKNAGLPFSHAADPYVSNPYRVPRFDESTRSQRKKPLEFDAALAVLQILETATGEDDAFKNLAEVVYALRRFIANHTVSYPLPSRVSLEDTLRCVAAFTTVKSGGARLQAVVYALFNALAAQGMAYEQIRTRHVNASDTSSKSAGDVAFSFGSETFAVEVKDRALSKAEFEATIEKCRLAQVRETLFVVRAPDVLEAEFPVEDFHFECERQFSSGLNIYVESFDALTRVVMTLVGETGRRSFLESVGSALRDQNADIKHKWAWAALVKEI